MKNCAGLKLCAPTAPLGIPDTRQISLYSKDGHSSVPASQQEVYVCF